MKDAWQPIETAPKEPDAKGDTPYVLLYEPGGVYVIARWRKTIFGHWAWDDGDTSSDMDGFTHWQPLTPPADV